METCQARASVSSPGTARLAGLAAPDPDHVTAQVLDIAGFAQHRVVIRRGGQGHARHLADPQLSGQGRAGPSHLVLPAAHEYGPAMVAEQRGSGPDDDKDGQTEDRPRAPSSIAAATTMRPEPRPTRTTQLAAEMLTAGPDDRRRSERTRANRSVRSQPDTRLDQLDRPRRRHPPPHGQGSAQPDTAAPSSVEQPFQLRPARTPFHPTVRGEQHRPFGVHQPGGGRRDQHRDLAHPTHPGLVPADVHHRMQGRR